MTGNLKKVLLQNLPYLIFVYVFDKLIQAVRLAPGIDASQKLLHLSQGFSEAFSNMASSLHLLDLGIGVPPGGRYGCRWRTTGRTSTR